ncbi:death domain-associated protein 6-like isoform X2 [Euwallacea fornicatus]|uniref:death domain-associated protein 6-like isoform X2 n=1 Tax=Euwallacea fornicatus TaxID=995702 RepID=UPI00338F2BFF
MSDLDQVISLSSSDEENKLKEPCAKKRRISPIIVPNVSISMFSVSKAKNKRKQISKKKGIETVSLDSDDDDDDDSTSTLRTSSGASGAITVNGKKSLASNNCNSQEINALIDSIMESDVAFKRNGVTIWKKKSETVSLLDSDSDSGSEEKAGNESGSSPLKEPIKPIIIVDDNRTSQLKTSISSKKSGGIDANEDVMSPLCNEVDENTASKKAIVIPDSDEETEKENLDIESLESFSDRSILPNLSKEENVCPESRALLEAFLEIVKESLKSSTFEEMLPTKVPILEKYFRKSASHVNEPIFQNLLKHNIESVKKASNSGAAKMAVIAFHKIFSHLKSHITATTIMVEEEHLPKVKKLEKIMKLLRKKIKHLEAAEVNFEEDGNSSYMILDRYQSRLKKVYAKYCVYIKRNPFSGRPVYDRISFVQSKYNEINQALSKKYNNSVHFPTYYEFEKCIRKVVTKHKLDLAEQEIKTESEKGFKHLGSILQKKRRQELYDSHLDFVEYTEDPASGDISLENTLRKNYTEGKEKLDKFFLHYVDKQEQGGDHISSNEEESPASASESDADVIEHNDIKESTGTKECDDGYHGESDSNGFETVNPKENPEEHNENLYMDAGYKNRNSHTGNKFNEFKNVKNTENSKENEASGSGEGDSVAVNKSDMGEKIDYKESSEESNGKGGKTEKAENRKDTEADIKGKVEGIERVQIKDVIDTNTTPEGLACANKEGCLTFRSAEQII